MAEQRIAHEPASHTARQLILSRRRLLRNTALLGVGAFSLSGLLAACGTAATPTSAPAAPAPTTAAAAGAPAATQTVAGGTAVPVSGRSS